MLKIQDAAYVGEGQSATLDGTKGNPASWRWHTMPRSQGLLTLAFKDGKLSVTQNGKPVVRRSTKASRWTQMSMCAGEPTQVGAGVNGWRIFVYNQKNPAAMNFKGVAYFPFDPAFRVTAKFIADPKLPPRVFAPHAAPTSNSIMPAMRVFTLKGKRITLPFYAESNDPEEMTDMSAFYHRRADRQGRLWRGPLCRCRRFRQFPPAKVVDRFQLSL